MTNRIKNISLSRRDIELAINMLGSRKYIVQEKTTQIQRKGIDINLQWIYIPKMIRKFYNDIILGADVMHVNDMLFVSRISENINYGTIRVVNNLICPKLESELQNIVQSYAIRGFRVILISVDI